MVVTTTSFEKLTRTVSAALGLPDARTVVVDHPIGGIDASIIIERADAAVEALLQHFQT